jgi:hypothetical protein
MNGYCSDATGNGAQGRCICPFGLDFVYNATDDESRDDAVFWCDWGTDVVDVSFPVSVVYAEARIWSDTRWRPLPAFPTTWTCGQRSAYCWTRDDKVVYATYAGNLLLDWNRTLQAAPHMVGHVQNATLPLSLVSWTCSSDVDLFFYKINDHAATVSGRGGMRPVGEHCHTQQPCSVHGTLQSVPYIGGGDEADTSVQKCVCDGGYFGDACQFTRQGDVFVDGSFTQTNTAAIFQNCSTNQDCGANETCYASQRCWCSSGFVWLGGSGGCVASASWTYFGAPLEHNHSTSVDLLVMSSDPSQVFFDDGYAWHFVYTQTPPLLNDSFYRLNTSHYWSFYCHYVSDRRNETVSMLEDAYKVCGGVAACPSEAFRGLDCEHCVDPDNTTGPGCDLTPLNCSALLCSGNGTCVEAKTGCDCEPRYYGDKCETWSLNCSLTRCGGHGLCIDANRCQCTAGHYGHACGVNTDACRESRCGGRGTCLTQLQGCDCDYGWTQYANCSTKTCYNQGVLVDGNCVCTDQWSGDYCGNTRCGNGTWNSTACECTGLWTWDVLGNCTMHPCGKGTPQNHTHCACPYPYAHTTGTESDAQYAHPTCVLLCGANGQFIYDQCVCAPAYGGLWCDQFVGYPQTTFPRTSLSLGSILMFGVVVPLVILAYSVHWCYVLHEKAQPPPKWLHSG